MDNMNVTHLLFLESGIFLSVMSTVWEDTNGCAKNYRCALDICLTTVLSSSYIIIMDRAINQTFFGKKMEIIGKLGSNDTKNIGMLTSASKDTAIKFADQCINILNITEGLNGIKGSTKIRNR